MKYEIKVASSEEELNALYRFRYKIYVEEMQRQQKDADHTRKIITDALDEGAANLIAIYNNNIVGAARINLSGSITDEYKDFYEIKEQEGCLVENSSIVTRLMVDETHRKSTLTHRIFIECYEYGIYRNINYNFVDCNDHLIGLFESFGYKFYIGKKQHHEYGMVNQMMLNLHDEAHFRKINSPFLKPYLNWKANTNVALQALI